MKSSRRRPKKLRSSQSQVFLIAACFSVFLAIVITVITIRPEPSESKVPEQNIRFVNDDDMIVVPTPARPIARGEKIENVPIASIKWPKSRLSTEYIADVSQFRNAIALTPLPKLLPIPVSAVSSTPLDNNQVIESIPPGMRAITVRVDVESGVEGWAQSGNYVDVMLVRLGKDSDSGVQSTIVAENIKILSAGRSAEPLPAEQMAPKTPTTVTLLTSQEEALRIKTAASLGKLTFSLRGFQDRDPTNVKSIGERSIFAQGKTSSPATKGTARGPDGKSYVLRTGSQWAPLASEENHAK